MAFPCTYCGQTCKSRGGLSQHISQKKACFDKEQLAIGIDPNRSKKKVTPPKRPGMPGGRFAKYVPRSAPFVGRFTNPTSSNQAVRPKITARSKPAKLHVNVSTGISDQCLETWEDMQGSLNSNKTKQCRNRSNQHSKTVHFAHEDDEPLLDNGDETSDDESELELTHRDDMDGIDEDVVEGEEDFNNDGHPNANVDRTMRDGFEKYCDTFANTHMDVLTKEEKRGIRLLDIMKRKACPMDTYEELMLWFLRETGKLDQDERLADNKHTGYISREKLLATLKKRYNMENKFPVIKPLTLPASKAKVELVCHDASGAIESLLTDPRLTDHDFAFFNDDPFGEPPERSTLIGDLHTGDAYRAAYQKYKRKKRQIPLPVTLYIDGAQTAQMKAMPVTAMKMSLGIFTKDYRKEDHAHRIIGHLGSHSKKASRAKNILKTSLHIDGGCVIIDEGEGAETKANPADPAHDLHAMLDVIMESFVEVQEKGFKWDLRYKGKTHHVEFVPYVIFVKCDAQEGDALCGSYLFRGDGVKCLCRYCVCPTMDSHNSQANYAKKTVSMIKALTDVNDLEGLRNISQHPLKNAFYNIRFSPHNDLPLGIHSACPSEMLHATLLGTFNMTRNTLYETVGKKSGAADGLDELSQLFGKAFGRQSERDMPKCFFTEGIREGKLNAKEYRGILVVMATIMRSKVGQDLLIDEEKKMTMQQMTDWANLCEVLLCWEAFLCQDEILRLHVMRLKSKNRYLMWLMSTVSPRTTGMGHNLTKFHAITHMADDIIVNGVPTEVDTGFDESGHKLTKVAAGMTQRNSSTFDFQTGTRLDEFQLIDLGNLEIAGHKLWRYHDKPATPDKIVKPPPPKQKTCGAMIHVFKDENGKPRYSMGKTRKEALIPSTIDWDADVLEFLEALQEKVKPHIPKLEVRCEHQRHGHIFRGHPHYREKHWRDWILVDWGSNEPEPAVIWCFVVLSGIPKQKKRRRTGGAVPLNHGHCNLVDGVFAVVESATWLEDAKQPQKSMLFRKLELTLGCRGTGVSRRRKFFLVDVDAIAEAAVVIPDVGCANKCTYFHVKGRHDWVNAFEDWLTAPLPQEYLDFKRNKK